MNTGHTTIGVIIHHMFIKSDIFVILLILINFTFMTHAKGVEIYEESTPQKDTLLTSNTITNSKHDSIIDATEKVSVLPITNADKSDITSIDTIENLIKDSSSSTLRLSLDSAVSLLLQNNPDIRRAYLEWRSNQDKLEGTYGTYEPSLIGKYRHETAERPTTLFPQIQNNYTSGIEGLLPSATKYEMNLSVTDLKYRFTDNTSLPYTLMNITVSQPLLKGLWFGKPIIDLKVAKAEKAIALQKYRSSLFAKVFELEIAYWKLCLSQEKLKNAAHSVGIAREIVDDSHIQLRTGKISQLDAVEASAALASRENDLNDARKELITAINECKILITAHNSLTDTILMAVTPVYINTIDNVKLFNICDSIDFKKIQPDYLQRQCELEREQLSVDYQTDQCLPELNLKGSCGYLVSGRKTDVVWNNFINSAYRKRSGNFTAEIEFRLPLGMNIRERKLLNAEKKNLRSTEINLYAIQTQIENYLFASHKRISDLKTNLRNASIVINFRTALLDAEIAKQKAGKSTYRKIFEIEEELTKSKQWEIENIIDLRSLKSQIARLSGTLLLDRGLEIIEKDAPVLQEAYFGKP